MSVMFFLDLWNEGVGFRMMSESWSEQAVFRRTSRVELEQRGC
jgi:hypothetical protein